jgi:hypothetical protein
MRKLNSFLALNMAGGLTLGIRRSGTSSTTELRFWKFSPFGEIVGFSPH